uniref:Uncharacterized protein n=1 Tax=Rhizophora mucronata TaxID=61149 RepID=A0A2P2JSA5_RHIMU
MIVARFLCLAKASGSPPNTKNPPQNQLFLVLSLLLKFFLSVSMRCVSDQDVQPYAGNA